MRTIGSVIVGPGPPPAAEAASARRAELADFLRSRRAAVDPATLGIEVGSRRRTPGLRREEVAQRAGVGLSWYTWLEQGRDVTPSAHVLQALGRALDLTPTELDHLYVLAGAGGPRPPEPVVDEATLALVEALSPYIAYVLDPCFDVVAHNRPTELIMPGLVTAPPGRRNLLRWLFAPETGWRERAWEATARANLRDFRAEYARHPADPRYATLVAELSAASAHFRDWWAAHDVQALEPTHKHIPHPTLGTLHLLQSQSRPTHQPALRLRILVPADPTTRATLAAAGPPAG